MATEGIKYKPPILDHFRVRADQCIFRSVCVKEEAVDDYNVYSQEYLKQMVWSGGCRSWYKNGKVDGKITAMYAGSILQHRGQYLVPTRSYFTLADTR